MWQCYNDLSKSSIKETEDQVNNNNETYYCQFRLVLMLVILLAGKKQKIEESYNINDEVFIPQITQGLIQYSSYSE